MGGYSSVPYFLPLSWNGFCISVFVSGWNHSFRPADLEVYTRERLCCAAICGSGFSVNTCLRESSVDGKLTSKRSNTCPAGIKRCYAPEEHPLPSVGMRNVSVKKDAAIE